MPASPRVAIGLPVFNGADYLDEAIRSILEQTFTDFELIIADNNSTDDTEAICRRHAAADKRVRYVRHDDNIGAAPNFNFTFEQASAPLFKWAAHDDVLAPTYLERCIAMLDERPDAVLCQSLVQIVDRAGDILETYDHTQHGTDDQRPSRRFGGKLLARHCLEIFGVIQSDALRETPLIRSYIGSDRTLLLELGLKGPMLVANEPLLINRKYSAYTEKAERDPRELLAWYAPRQRRQAMSTWSFYRDGVGMIIAAEIGLKEKTAAAGWLARSLGRRWRWAMLFLEPLNKIDPRFFFLARSLKRSLGGSRQGRAQARS